MLIRKAAGLTDVGRLRDCNEDAFHVDDELGLYIVSDGLGGHAAGEIASATAVAAAREVIEAGSATLKQVAARSRPSDALKKLAARAVAAAGEAVHACASSSAGRAGMGCTLTLLIVCGGTGAMAHIGDSRLYLMREAQVSQLSRDHTIVGELARAGYVPADEVEGHPFAGFLSRALGHDALVQVDTLLLELLPGDRLLLCSDGFSNYLPESDDLVTALNGDDLSSIVRGLVDSANAAGGTDNITVVVVECEANAPQAERVSRIEDQYDALEAVSMFRDLGMRRQVRIMEACTMEAHATGVVAVEQGQPLEELLMVASGAYEIRLGAEVVGELQRGEHAAATTLFYPRRAHASLVAREPSQLLVLRREGLRRLIRARPRMGMKVLERLGQQLSEDYGRTSSKTQS